MSVADKKRWSNIEIYWSKTLEEYTPTSLLNVWFQISKHRTSTILKSLAMVCWIGYYELHLLWPDYIINFKGSCVNQRKQKKTDIAWGEEILCKRELPKILFNRKSNELWKNTNDTFSDNRKLRNALKFIIHILFGYSEIYNA